MLQRLKQLVSQHKHVIVGGTVIVSSAFFAIRFAQKRLLEWQDNRTKEYITRLAKEQHFTSTEKTCHQIIASLGESLKINVDKLLDAEKLLSKLRSGTGNKFELWSELKITVFTHLCTLLYSSLMLVILLKIQLSILSGYLFTENVDVLPLNFQEDYLSLCQHFLETGIPELTSVIKKNVTIVLRDVSLKKEMTLQDVEQIFWSIETSLSYDEMDPIRNSAAYLLPQVKTNWISQAGLSDEITEDTYELLESDEAISVAYSCIKKAFSNIVDQIAGHFNTADVNITKSVLPMAKIVPIIHTLFKTGGNDDCITQFLLMDKINMLGANIYQAFSNKQLH
ncbi:peroxisomal biogenesis factor 3 [Cimex lectularius]|uniref:Peroxisomal biogenesis factor 3 n=1 Tax=Cimex lectularius TaxID=79782 RepID=A0A8I6RAY4_CIMLE|nr:peroxisomal biogenesis factor 3 [Cimex lectularius]